MTRTRLDQGSLGHSTRKPTVLLSNIPEVMQLGGLYCDAGSNQRSWDGSVGQRIERSKQLAEWAPGLCAVLGEAILRRASSQPSMKKVTPKEKREVQAWREHYRCGHLPFRGDCSICLIAGGRDKPHPVKACPTSYCLSLDVMGPFREGHDQEVNNPRYALIAVYTVPIDGEGCPLPAGLAELRKNGGHPHALDEREEDVDETEELRGDHPSQEDEDPLQIQDEQEEDEQGLSELEAKAQEVNEKKWKEFLQERKAFHVRNITFGVPLKDRSVKEVIKSTSQIYARARAMRLPITRVHTDRAKEWAFQQWCLGRDIFHTMTSGDDPLSNSRCEREVGWVKSRTRTLLLATKSSFEVWPLAIRQASEERLRSQVRRMGIDVPELLPFGTAVVVKKKNWHQREDGTGMKWPMKRATLWGPASDMSMSSRAYYVKDDEGRYFRTTVVRQVKWEQEKNEDAKRGSKGLYSRSQLKGRPHVSLTAAVSNLMMESTVKSLLKIPLEEKKKRIRLWWRK